MCAGRSTEAVMKDLQENYTTYKQIDTSLQRRKAHLMGKLPELTKTQAAIELLIKKNEEGAEVRAILHYWSFTSQYRSMSYPQVSLVVILSVCRLQNCSVRDSPS